MSAKGSKEGMKAQCHRVSLVWRGGRPGPAWPFLLDPALLSLMDNWVLCPAAELANGLAGSAGGHMRGEIQSKTLNYKSVVYF